MLQLNDPTDNRGLGWVRLTEEQLVVLLYIGLKVARGSYRRDLNHRNAEKADAAAKAISRLLAERLRQYPVFGPARVSEVPTCGGGREPGAEAESRSCNETSGPDVFGR